MPSRLLLFAPFSRFSCRSLFSPSISHNVCSSLVPFIPSFSSLPYCKTSKSSKYSKSFESPSFPAYFSSHFTIIPFLPHLIPPFVTPQFECEMITTLEYLFQGDFTDSERVVAVRREGIVVSMTVVTVGTDSQLHQYYFSKNTIFPVFDCLCDE